MKTAIEKASPESLARAAEVLKRGGLVAFPTETVYGLGADGLDGSAAARIFAAKGRPQDNPLILHIARREDASALAEDIPPGAAALMDAFWPGPLTLILPKKECVPREVSGGLGTVGIRMPAHPVARGLALACGFPIAAPSANSSGRPSPTLAAHVAHDLGGKIDMILDGGAADWGLESTVAEVSGGGVCVLRPGAVTLEQLRGVVPNVWLDAGVASGVAASAPKAPGMKYRHYSPEARLVLVTGGARRVSEYILEEAGKAAGREAALGNGKSRAAIGILASAGSSALYAGSGHTVLSLGDASRPEHAAASLFRLLREFDGLGVRLIFAEGMSERGLGLAVMNRLRKAASAVAEV